MERYWFEVLQKDLEWGSSDGYKERTGDACKLLIFCFVRFGILLKIVRGCRQVTLFYSMCMAIAFFWVTTFCIMIGSRVPKHADRNSLVRLDLIVDGQ